LLDGWFFKEVKMKLHALTIFVVVVYNIAAVVIGCVLALNSQMAAYVIWGAIVVFFANMAINIICALIIPASWVAKYSGVAKAHEMARREETIGD
jgi:hypothetical protein